MIGDPGELGDQAADAVQGPAVGGESGGAGAVLQGLRDRRQLLVGQARGGAGWPQAAQSLQAVGPPAGVPAADDLVSDVQLTGDLGLGAPGGEQRTGLQADSFERLAVTHAPSVATVGGWSHPTMLPGQPDERTGTNEVLFRCLGLVGVVGW